MNLKTTYKNDMYAGKRKYRLENHADGTISLDDVTVYTQEGDIFSADDMNATNQAVNEIDTDNTEFRKKITDDIASVSTDVKAVAADAAATSLALTGETILNFPAFKWSVTSPYTQTIPFPGLKESDSPIYGLRLSGALSSVTVEAQKLAWGYVDRIVSGNGQVTAYCYSKKPAADLAVSVKGVKRG